MPVTPDQVDQILAGPATTSAPASTSKPVTADEVAMALGDDTHVNTDPPSTEETFGQHVQRVAHNVSNWAGRRTANAVDAFQRVSDLPLTSILTHAATEKGNNINKALGDSLSEQGYENLANKPTPQYEPWGDKGSLPEALHGEMANAGIAPESPALDADIPGFGGQVSARQLGNAVLHKSAGRALNLAQRQVGTPIATGLDYVRDASYPMRDAVGQTPFSRESEKVLSKELLSGIAGEEFKASPDVTRSADDELKGRFGHTGAWLLHHTASLAGDIPFFMMTDGLGELGAGDAMTAKELASLPTSSIAKLIKGASGDAAASTFKRNVTGFALQSGLLASSKKGEDAFTSAGEGALVGGLFGALGAMKQSRSFWKDTNQAIKDQLSSAVPSSEQHQAALLSPKTQAEFIQQLNESIDRAKANFKGKILRPGAADVKAQGALWDATHGTQLEQPNFDVREGKVTKPTFSAWAKDADGNQVVRDYELLPETAAPEKFEPGATRVQKLGAKTDKRLDFKRGQTTTLGAVRYRDTPVADAEAMSRQQLQPGRTWLLSADDPVAGHTAWRGIASTMEPYLAGTGETMAPEQMREFGGMQVEAALQKQAKRAQGTVAGRKPNVALTVGKDGAVQATPIPVREAREAKSMDFRPGDTVKLDGDTLASVRGMRDGQVTVETPHSPSTIAVPPHRVALTSHEVFDARTQPVASASPTSLHPRTEALIKASQDVTPIDLLKFEGRPLTDLPWAVHSLNELEAKGVVRRTPSGFFEPVRKHSIMDPRLQNKGVPQEGELVFTGKTGGDTGFGEVGVMRGPDPRTPGNHIVEMADHSQGETLHPTLGRVANATKFTSIPKEELRTMRPVGLADKSKIDPGIDAYGWNKPMPASYYVHNDAGTQAKMRQTWNAAQLAGPGSMQKAKEAMVGAMHTAPLDFRTGPIQKLFAMNPSSIASERLTRAQALASHAGGEGSPANVAFAKVLEARRARGLGGKDEGFDEEAMKKFAQEHPDYAEAIPREFEQTARENEENHAWLTKRGVDPVAMNNEKLRAKGASYLTQPYAFADMARKKWSQYAQKNLTSQMENFDRWATRNRPEHEGALHTALFDDIMHLNDPVQGLVDRGYIKGEDKKKLLSRGEVPPEVAAVLGKYNDSSTRLAASATFNRALRKRIEGFDHLAKTQEWSPGKRADMPLPVPDHPTFGNAAGGFVRDSPAVRELLGMDPKKAMDESNGLLRAIGYLGKAWKAGHTVYNQTSWVNNVVRNFKGLVLSGGFDGSPEHWEGFREASRQLAGYKENPSVHGPNKDLVEAIDYDAVPPGMSGTELRSGQKKWEDYVLKGFDREQGKNPNQFLRVMESMRDHASSLPEHIHEGYDLIDKTARFGSYLNIKRDLIAKGVSNADAAALASLRVNQSFASSFSHSPKWLGGGSSNWLNTAAPFATSKNEEMRVNATMVKRIADTLNPANRGTPKAEPDLLWRIAKMSGVVGTAATIANNMRRAGGISDKEDSDNRKTMTLRDQGNHPLLLGGHSYDSQGRQVFYPLETYEDVASAFRGNVNDPALGRFLFNNLEDYLGPQTAVGMGARDVAERAGVLTPTQQPHQPRPDQRAIDELLAKYGPTLLPQGPLNAMKAYDATKPGTAFAPREALTGDQAMLKGLGLANPTPVGPETAKASQREEIKNLLEAKSGLKGSVLDAALNGATPEQMKYMLQSNVRQLQKSVREIPRPLKKP